MNLFASISLLKIAKRVVFSHRNRGADVAHNGHVAGPREPTWTPKWCEEVFVLASDGPTG